MQDAPLERLVSLQLEAIADGASITLITDPQSQAGQAADVTQLSESTASQRKADTEWHLQVLKVLRHHVAQATEIAASTPGQQPNDVECKKVSCTCCRVTDA